MEIKSIYRAKILEHGVNPANFGELPEPMLVTEAANISCGDTLSLQAVVKGGRITAIAWQGEGCLVMKASASLLGEHILGKTWSDIKNLSAEEALGMLGVELTPSRTRCALLPLEAVRKLSRQ